MPVPEKTEGPVSRDEIDLRASEHHRACCRGSIRKDERAGLQGRNRPESLQTPQCLLSGKHAMPVPEKTEGRFAGTQTNCGPANTAGPAVGEACDARARKNRRAGEQGRKRIAAPQTPQGLLSGKHAMSVSENTEGPVFSGTQSTCVPALTAGPAVGEACDDRARKGPRAGLQGQKGIAAPQTP